MYPLANCFKALFQRMTAANPIERISAIDALGLIRATGMLIASERRATTAHNLSAKSGLAPVKPSSRATVRQREARIKPSSQTTAKAQPSKQLNVAKAHSSVHSLVPSHDDKENQH